MSSASSWKPYQKNLFKRSPKHSTHAKVESFQPTNLHREGYSPSSRWLGTALLGDRWLGGGRTTTKSSFRGQKHPTTNTEQRKKSMWVFFWWKFWKGKKMESLENISLFIYLLYFIFFLWGGGYWYSPQKPNVAAEKLLVRNFTTMAAVASLEQVPGCASAPSAASKKWWHVADAEIERMLAEKQRKDEVCFYPGWWCRILKSWVFFWGGWKISSKFVWFSVLGR